MKATPEPLRALLMRDFFASIVVFLVALPLCLGIAIAANVPPILGLATGIVGGIVVGLLAGSPMQVTGPAAGLVVLVLDIVQSHGLAVLGLVVFLAGVLQLAAGALRLGQWFRAVSPAVIRGMLAGIGVLIFASQFHVLFDIEAHRSGVAHLLAIPGTLLDFVSSGSELFVPGLVGLGTLAVLVLWHAFKPRSLRFIPGPLLGVVLATFVVQVLSVPVVTVEIPENLFDAFTLVSLEAFQRVPLSTIVLESVAIAFIASAETLLCATAVDQMHHGTTTNYDKELVAQGVGNIICGSIGALPATGVIVRSSANVEAGARTRWSAVLHGVWILALVMIVPLVYEAFTGKRGSFLEMIPRSSLAAILVFTGYRLFMTGAVRELRKFGWSEVVIYFATVLTIVGSNLLNGVLLGLGLSVVKLIYTFSRLVVRVEKEKPGLYRVHMWGAATFLALPNLARELESIPTASEVHIHFDALDYIDHACLDMISNYGERLKSSGGKFVVEWDELYGRYHRAYDRRSSAAPGRRSAPEGVVTSSVDSGA